MEKSLREVDSVDTLALLAYRKIKFVSFKREGTKITFLYEDTPEFKETISAFHNKTIKVDPADYNFHVKNVLRIIKEIQRGVIK